MQPGERGGDVSDTAFSYRVTDGWLRDLASEPTPSDPWPCIRWDDRLLADQMNFLDVLFQEVEGSK